VVIAHADLPLARGLAALARDGSRPVIAAVPCHRDDGTPVLALPTAAPFVFAYGPGSFRRHAAEARRLGLAFRVVRDPALAHDVDAPEDLRGLELPSGRRRLGQQAGVPPGEDAFRASALA
jgi:2-phospho-L-lactate guanylyltransferase